MSYLDYNMNEVEELKTVPEDEYQVECMDAEVRTSEKTGGDYIMLSLEVVGEENVKDISHVMMLPAPGDRPKDEQRRLWNIKQALKAFEVPYDQNGFAVEDFQGRRAWAYLVEEDEGGQYGVQNRVRKFSEKQ